MRLELALDFFVLGIVYEEFVYLRTTQIEILMPTDPNKLDKESIREKHRLEEEKHNKAAEITSIVVLVVILAIVGTLAYFLTN